MTYINRALLLLAVVIVLTPVYLIGILGEMLDAMFHATICPTFGLLKDELQQSQQNCRPGKT